MIRQADRQQGGKKTKSGIKNKETGSSKETPGNQRQKKKKTAKERR